MLDRICSVSQPGVAGAKQRDRNLAGRILLEHLHTGRHCRPHGTRAEPDLRLAPPCSFEQGIDGKRGIEIGLCQIEPPHIVVEQTAVD